MKKSKVWFRLLRAVVHVLAVAGSFWIMYYVRLQTDLIPGVQLRILPIDTTELAIFAGLAALVFFLWGVYHRFYQLFLPFAKNYRKLIVVWTYWIVTMTFLAYFGSGFIFTSGISRFILVWSALVSLLLLYLIEWFWLWAERRIEKVNPTLLLFIYRDENEFAHVEHAVVFKRYQHVESLHVDDFTAEKVRDFDHVIAVGGFPKHILQDMFDAARLAGKRFFHIAEGFFLEDVVYVPDRLGTAMAFEYKPSQLDGWAIVLKRLVDMFGSFLAIVLLSPVFLIAALMVKFDSRGPVFYLQKRVGRNGELFTFIKFRSMYLDDCVGDNYGGAKALKKWDELMNSENNVRKGELQKIENDPRVTRVGRFLRRTSLDELPNLFSVLIGDMSLVGPRPHLPSEIEKYKAWHKRLLSIKPGITGYAQIKGRDMLTFDQEAYYDLAYIQQWSILLDFWILLKTVGVVFLKSNR